MRLHAGLALALLLAAPAAMAQLTKCVAANGRVSYVDGPCPQGAKPAAMTRPEAPSAPNADQRGRPAVPEAGGGGAIGTPEQRSRVEWFEVDGGDAPSLRASILARKPSAVAGNFYAYARWAVSYTFDPAPFDGGCRAGRVNTKMEGVIHAPRWSKRGGASPELMASWDRFHAALMKHEEGHLEHGRALARELHVEIPKVIAATCQALGPAVEARYHALAKQYHERDKSYDARTDHGRKQGAVF